MTETIDLNETLKALAISLRESGPTYKAAKAIWRQHRVDCGMAANADRPLLTHPRDNTKLNKSLVPTFGLSLLPANASKRWNLCPWYTPLCRAGCLNTAGNGLYPGVQRGRYVRTAFLAEHPMEFLVLLRHELRKAVRKHEAINVRLNVLSDLEWEAIDPFLFEIEGVQFYDYTKSISRVVAARHAPWWPENYHLTYSFSERDTDNDVWLMLKNHNVSGTMVFWPEVPSHWDGIPIVDGDKTDDRTLDPSGTLVGLLAKGRMARRPRAFQGFIRQPV